jgi:predicted MFS family arabinose efflux permease
MTLSARSSMALVFLSFAFAYFPSALVRGVVATLAPAFSSELQLTASELGLLAGAYFFGFAAMQLPLGSALDRFGPKRVLLLVLAVAVLGCSAFAVAQDFLTLTIARALIGVGVSACLMAPMTSFRLNFQPTAQMRANSWMLMTGSLGLIASTLPVQWLMPILGWRGLFWALALLFVVAMVLIAQAVPADRPVKTPVPASPGGYAEVFRHPVFVRYLPMGFFQYGGLVALQSLWVGPWLTRVCGWTPAETAAGLFGINVAMLFTFMSWGFLVPRLYARGRTAHGLIARGMPLPVMTLVVGVALGPDATAWVWGLFCVFSTFVSLSQPAIAQAFPASLAGRALSAYNLVIFAGVFALQWGMGAVVDALIAAGWSAVSAFQGAFALLAVCCSASYLWFLWRREPEPGITGAATAR